jgi:predicted nucleic acid-binding protein
MNAVLIDTNIYSYAALGEPGAVEIFQSFERILFSPVAVGELLAGFKGGSREKQNTQQLHRFLGQRRVEVVGINQNTSTFYAMILDTLKRQGTPIPTNDLWIAASALEHGVPLATRDKHFRKIPGLLMVD